MLELESQSRWLRIEQAAKYASVSVHFVKQLVRKREIVPIKAGKYFLIDRLDLDKYLEGLKVQQGNGNG
jgi:excisionase family DNA binding protein